MSFFITELRRNDSIWHLRRFRFQENKVIRTLLNLFMLSKKKHMVKAVPLLRGKRCWKLRHEYQAILNLVLDCRWLLNNFVIVKNIWLKQRIC